MRERLPGRRHVIRGFTRWPLDDGQKIHIDAGFTPDGRLMETFLRGGGHVASDLDNTLDDAAKCISLAIQFGCPIATIAATLGREGDGKPSSVIGAAVDKLAEIVREEGLR